jgi:hypothetical protein
MAILTPSDQLSSTIRAAIYARTATAQQYERDLAIQAQVQTCREYAAAKGYIVTRELIDSGSSSTTLDRPGMQALRACVQHGEIDVILTIHPNRLTRDFRDMVILWKEWEQAGLQLDRMGWTAPSGTTFEEVFRSYAYSIALLEESIFQEPWALRLRHKRDADTAPTSDRPRRMRRKANRQPEGDA